MEILQFEDLGDTSVFGGTSCSSPRRVSNFNSKEPQGGIYPYIKFERDRLNTFRFRVFTSSRRTRTRRRDAKTIISPNTSFGDIINQQTYVLACKMFFDMY